MCVMSVMLRIIYALYDCFACFCQRTEKCARKTQVFASVCSQVKKGRGGFGRGGMWTFLVLLPLHVVTLHRCLVALLRCIHVALLHICMYIYMYIYMYMWICIPISSKNKFNAEAPALKRRKEKTCQHAPMKWIQNPHETRILPNSRARIWQHSACRNVCFAMAKIIFFWTTFLRARFPVRRDVFVYDVYDVCYVCTVCYVYHMYIICMSVFICIYIYYVICIYIYIYICMYVCVFVGIIYIYVIDLYTIVHVFYS